MKSIDLEKLLKQKKDIEKEIILEQKRVKNILAENKRFERASAKGKRIMIAEDVILQLKIGKFTAMESAGYLNMERDNGSYHESIDTSRGEELQNTIISKDVSCTVCGIGGVFASCVRINNNYKKPTYDLGQYEIHKHLEKFFTREQLLMIEASFERAFIADNSLEFESKALQSQIKKSIKFGEKHENDNRRLAAIMQNIIDNNGTFIPTSPTKSVIRKKKS